MKRKVSALTETTSVSLDTASASASITTTATTTVVGDSDSIPGLQRSVTTQIDSTQTIETLSASASAPSVPSASPPTGDVSATTTPVRGRSRKVSAKPAAGAGAGRKRTLSAPPAKVQTTEPTDKSPAPKSRKRQPSKAKAEDTEAKPSKKRVKTATKAVAAAESKETEEEAADGEADGSEPAEKKTKTKKGAKAAAGPLKRAKSADDLNIPADLFLPRDTPKVDGTMRLMTWNVNGLRACLKKGFVEHIKKQQPDVVCLNEVKCTQQESGLTALRSEYKIFWNDCTSQAGYSGTAVLSKLKPLSVTNGIGAKKHDDEGRTITVEFPDFFLVNTYVPNAGQKLERLPYRTSEWDSDLLAYLKKLEATKPVIWTGDLNVAHQDIDIHDPVANRRSAGFTKEERENFAKVLASGFVDIYRHLYPKEKERCYTYWTYRFNCKAKNKGWRLDYFVCSPALLSRVHAFHVHSYVNGSDHCPIVLDVKHAADGASSSSSSSSVNA